MSQMLVSNLRRPCTEGVVTVSRPQLVSQKQNWKRTSRLQTFLITIAICTQMQILIIITGTEFNEKLGCINVSTASPSSSPSF